MNRMECVESLRRRLVGRRVQMVQMNDDPNPIPPGEQGTIACIDDAGTFHVTWASGRSLGVIPGKDEFTFLDTDEEAPHVPV